MFDSNYCFLTCIQETSQETGKMVIWYSHLLKNIPQFIVIYTVKGFSIVNKAKVDAFLEFPCSLYVSKMLVIWTLVPLAFPACTPGSSQVKYWWSPAWRIFGIIFQACGISAILKQFEPSLALPFFGIGMKTDLFQSCSHCWVFQICWHTECSTFIASSCRIWNSSVGIPSHPLALFVVMLP